MTKHVTEWEDRTAFHEVAEALGISTEYILALSSEGAVLWTPSEEPDGDIWRGLCQRDADGIVHVIHREFSSSVADLHKMIDGELRKKLGPPEGE